MSFERDGTLDHGVEKHTQTPDICWVALITVVENDFRSKVGRRTALFIDRVALFYKSTYAEITKLDTTFSIHEYIIELDVTVQHTTTMTVAERVQYLFKNCLGALFVKTFSFLNILKKVAATRVLHDHQEVLFTLKDLEKADHTRVPYFLKNIDFLENFAPTVLIFDVYFIDALDGHILAGKLVNAQSNLSKGTLAE